MVELKPGHKCPGCGKPLDSDGCDADGAHHYGPCGCGNESSTFMSNLAKLKHKKVAELKAHLGMGWFGRKKGSKDGDDRLHPAGAYPRRGRSKGRGYSRDKPGGKVWDP